MVEPNCSSNDQESNDKEEGSRVPQSRFESTPLITLRLSKNSSTSQQGHSETKFLIQELLGNIKFSNYNICKLYTFVPWKIK
jgi:hypothetical protein